MVFPIEKLILPETGSPLGSGERARTVRRPRGQHEKDPERGRTSGDADVRAATVERWRQDALAGGEQALTAKPQLMTRVEQLQNLLVARATGAGGDDSDYRALRAELLAINQLAPLLL
jgi:hypothetical protein